jgi:nucleoid-associated protein YgaU
MNKQNAFFLVAGVVVFAGLLWFVWGSKAKNLPQGPKVVPSGAGDVKKPANATGQQPLPKPVEPAPEPKLPEAGQPGVQPPVNPVEPVAPKAGPDDASAKTPEEAGEGFGNLHITADTGVVEESARAEAAGNQEVPIPWLKKDKKKDTGDAEQPKALPKTYTAARNTTLYAVAETVYGDARKWQLLFEANKNVIEDAEHVAEGTVLTVPDPENREAGAAPTEKKKSSLVKGLF